jgi:outer membrane protein assembly factor BamB
MQQSTYALVLACVALAGLGPSSARAASWPQWRGPDRDGTTSEPSGHAGGKWSPAKIWEKNDWGEGTTSPILVKGRIFVMGYRGGKDTVCCLRATDGAAAWKRSYPAKQYSRKLKTPSGNKKHFGGPFSTPAYDAASDRLFTLSCDGDLRAWSAKSGAPAWHLSLYDRYSIPLDKEHFGHTSSPLVLGGNVIVEVGAKGRGNLIGFDVKTGSEKWRSGADNVKGRSSGPVAFSVSGTQCVASFSNTALLVVRATDGRVIGRHQWTVKYGHTIPSPTPFGGSLLVTSWSPAVTRMFEYSPSRGFSLAWETKAVSSKVCSPVVDDGHAYMVAGGKLACLDLGSKKRKWQSPRKFGGSDEGTCLVAGDGNVVVFGGNTLALVAPAKASGSYKELGSVSKVLSTTKRCYPHVVLAEGYVLCKDGNGSMACLRVGGKTRR